MEMTETGIWTIAAVLVSTVFLGGVFFMLLKAQQPAGRKQKRHETNAETEKRVER